MKGQKLFSEDNGDLSEFKAELVKEEFISGWYT